MSKPPIPERVARALALEFYRGEYRAKSQSREWMETYTAIPANTDLAAHWAEAEAQRCSELFWRVWHEEAVELCKP